LSTGRKNFFRRGGINLIGIINPREYVQYQRQEQKGAARSKSDQENLKALLERVQRHLIEHYNDEFVRAIIDEQARNRVKYYIADYIKEQREFRFTMEMQDVITHIQTEITEMGVLQPALDDPTISSIEINSPTEVIVEKNGFPVHMKEIRFQDVDHIYRTIDKMLAPVGGVRPIPAAGTKRRGSEQIGPREPKSPFGTCSKAFDRTLQRRICPGDY